MGGTQARKVERLEARVTRKQKRAITRAAELRGTSVTEFVVASAQQMAAEIIKDAQRLSLDGAAQQEFVSAILNPPVPLAAARAAANRYKSRVRK